MASFTETATLLVKDQSSSKIKKINAELKQLATTAKSLKSTTINLNVNATAVQRATRELASLRRELTSVRSAARAITLTVHTAAIQRASRELLQLHQALRAVRGNAHLNVTANSTALTTAQRHITQLQTSLQQLRTAPAVHPNVNATNITAAHAHLQTLIHDLQRLHTAAATSINVNHTGIAGAIAQLNQLRQAAANPITIRTQHAGGGGGPGGGGGGSPTGLNRYHTPVNQAVRGAASGLGVSGVVAGLSSLYTASYLAARGLRELADQTTARSRTVLQTQVQATAAQREVFKAAGVGAGVDPAVRLTNDQRERLRTSLLSDVQGGTSENPEERSINRAKNAVVVADFLESQMLPRLFAQKPNQTLEEALAGLRTLVQGVNLASTDIVNDRGEISEDGKRVIKGIQLAMAADPDLTPERIKTTLANLKTAGMTLSGQALAKVLINSGSAGVRVANETFTAMKAAGGGVDIKILNNALAKMGLLENVKRNDKGNVIASSGKPIESDLFDTDPELWLQKYFVPKMNADIAAAAGVTAKEVDEDPDSKYNVKKKRYIEQAFPGMRASAVQGITSMILGFDQMQSSIEQALDAMRQGVSEAVRTNLAAQIEGTGVAIKDVVTQIGTLGSETFNLAGAFSWFTAWIRKEGNNFVGGDKRTLIDLWNNPSWDPSTTPLVNPADTPKKGESSGFVPAFNRFFPGNLVFQTPEESRKNIAAEEAAEAQTKAGETQTKAADTNAATVAKPQTPPESLPAVDLKKTPLPVIIDNVDDMTRGLTQQMGFNSGSGGGLIQNANYSTGGGGGGGWGGGGDGGGGGGGTAGVGAARGSVGPGGDPRGVAAYIREAAAREGIDPDTAVAVAKSEGLGSTSYQSRVRRSGKGSYNGREDSWGAFQMYMGGGLGNRWSAANPGKDIRDPANEKSTIDFALQEAKKKGWGQWYGARRAGIGNFAGIGGRAGVPRAASAISLADVIPGGEGTVRELQSKVAGIRRGALDPRLNEALRYASERSGLIAEVTSGGQRMPGAQGATGSHRHDRGRAADFRLRDSEGNLVNVNDPRAMAFYRFAAQAGVTGGGTNYMGPHTSHLDIESGGLGSPVYRGGRAFADAVNRGKTEREEYRKFQNAKRATVNDLKEAGGVGDFKSTFSNGVGGVSPGAGAGGAGGIGAMNGAAPQIGAAIGRSAASHIQGAAKNLQVAVKTRNGGDTGSQRAVG